MSMPNIPEQKFRPSFKQVIIDLLESIALEETALSHLVNAEAEKIQHILNQSKSICPRELLTINKTVSRILDAAIIKEWLLLKKLDLIAEIEMKNEPSQDYEKTKNHCVFNTWTPPEKEIKK
ncbi:hypothetical protein SAMN02745885_01363 [Carboxydocella sporoproducens DSM 16521]|uniref:Uncharacterized protein n=2 Tax=Carboxydocella TaxID=178898 RepID=A0A1T4PQ66_9FIRM|nr:MULTISPECIES: hypothetical protein [Carboxydocella]AVX19698.1 hypothetical protein CFE_0499 [Carboxydocella thermautotrophica]SJZ93722.1 hypothetical protein SAMN02745885_01363 [Carboxydocella sporoproducens DSM 16521]